MGIKESDSCLYVDCKAADLHTDVSNSMCCVSVQENCYYHGHVEGMAESSVSVGICSGIR